METNNKSDFEKMAKEYVKFIVGTHDRPDITEHDFIQGCEKIWNDYVISERKHNAEMQTIRIEWRDNAIDKINSLETENQALKSELDKAVELLKECAIELDDIEGYGIARKLNDFLKDKR